MNAETTPAKVSARVGPEERLRLAESASGIGTFELDLVSGRWDVSRQVAALFGFDVNAAPSSFPDWERVVFVDDVPKMRSAASIARERGVYQVEFRVTHADGTVHWLAGKGTASGASPILHGAFIDISERKALEARLLALNETLETRIGERARELAANAAKLVETERRFMLLIEAVSDYAIFMLDREGRVVSWNVGAERIKGYGRDEILGQHFSRFYTDEDRRAGVPKTALATAARSGKYAAEGWRVRKDGTRFWASVVLNAIYDPERGLIGFAKVTRDLTERRQVEERLRQAEKMEAVGQLTGGVAHDFNNVLTVISGNIEAMLHEMPAEENERVRRLANAALRGTERAAVLVQQLLAFSRRQPLHPRTLTIHGFIPGMSELLRRAIGESISIETVIAGGIWRVFADQNQLENAIINLAVNARDAMPDGGRLTIGASNAYLDRDYAAAADIAPGQYVCIEVGDTGSGMTAEVAAQAFDPFFTTKPVGQGTGLGLSQVYGFIKQSGGHVKIYSEVGTGTTVKLYLPRHIAAEEAAEQTAAPAPLPRGQGEPVLVVEDDSDVRSATVEMLRELGYVVVEASEGESALRKLDADPAIRLLLTDVGLPGRMNGRQLADEALRRGASLKVLFTSGYARTAIVHHGRLDPGVELIAKPFTYLTLATQVRRLLDAS